MLRAYRPSLAEQRLRLADPAARRRAVADHEVLAPEVLEVARLSAPGACSKKVASCSPSAAPHAAPASRGLDVRSRPRSSRLT